MTTNDATRLILSDSGVLYTGRHTILRRGRLAHDVRFIEEQEEDGKDEEERKERGEDQGWDEASRKDNIVAIIQRQQRLRQLHPQQQHRLLSHIATTTSTTPTTTITTTTTPATSPSCSRSQDDEDLDKSSSSSFPILVKTLYGIETSPDDISRLKYELRAFGRLSSEIAEACFAPIALRRTQYGAIALLIPDSGGELLSTWIQTPRPLAELLRAIIAICNLLLTLHSAHIVVHLLMPSSILYNPLTHAVQFLDFSRSSLLQEEDANLSDSGLRSMSIELLQYTSPESTGRANRSMDARSDLYSLGCIIFAMVHQGRCPFNSDDALTLVHQHLAQLPPKFQIPHSQKNSSLSFDTSPTDPAAAPVMTILELIVRRLLSKSPEERYLSARGLLADLNWIETTLIQQINAKENAQSWSKFQIAEFDTASSFRLSGKLYGRTTEVHQLMDAFDRVACVENSQSTSSTTITAAATSSSSTSSSSTSTSSTSTASSSSSSTSLPTVSELILVGGFSGIGKTSIVEACQKLLVRSRAFFCSAKFDMYRRSAGILVSMLGGVLETILVSSPSERMGWSTRMTTALGGNGSLLFPLLPLLQEIIGPQPPLPSLSALERESILLSTFVKFIHVIAQPSHPLVLFLDDLQWSDSLSLQLIQKLLTEELLPSAELPSPHHSLLLIGAYRTNEVGPAHPLTLMIEQLRIWQSSETSRLTAIGQAPKSPRLHEIFLTGIPTPAIATFLQDSFFCHLQAATHFAQLLSNRCSGNPWYIKQVLHRLHADNLITFNSETVASESRMSSSTLSQSDTSTSIVASTHGTVVTPAHSHSSLGHWQWNLDEVAAAQIGSSVVELLSVKFTQLPFDQRMVLHRASILGNRFSLEQLSYIDDRPIAEVAAHLWELVTLGFILPVSQAYSLYLAAAPETHEMDERMRSIIQLDETKHSDESTVDAGGAPKNSIQSQPSVTAARIGIDPSSLFFVFAHDSCQQSAYQLTSLRSRKELHSKVAFARLQQLMKRISPTGQPPPPDPSPENGTKTSTNVPATTSSVAADETGAIAFSINNHVVPESIAKDLLDAAEHAVAASLSTVSSEVDLMNVIRLLLWAGQRAKNDTLWQLTERYLNLALDALYTIRMTPEETEQELLQMALKEKQKEKMEEAKRTAASNTSRMEVEEMGQLIVSAAPLDLKQFDGDDEASSLDEAASVDTEATLALAASIHGTKDGVDHSSSSLNSVAVSTPQPTTTTSQSECWTRAYQLSLAVHSLLCEVSYHTSNRPRAEQLMQVCLNQTQPPRPLMDRVHVLELRLAALCVHASAVKDAIGTGMEILQLCGQPILEFLPRSLEIEQTVMSLSGAGEELPECRDEKQLCVARTLSQLSPCAYLSQAEQPMLMADISATMLFHMLKHGTSGAIGVGLSIVSIFMWYQSTVLAATDMPAAEKRLNAALRMSDITMAVDARYLHHPDPRMSSRAVWGRAVNACWGSTYHYKYPLSHSVGKLMSGVQSLSLFGDASFLGHCIFFAQNHLTHSNSTLRHANQRNSAALRSLKAHNVLLSGTYFGIHRCALLFQMGETVDIEDQGDNQWPPSILSSVDDPELSQARKGSDNAHLWDLLCDARKSRKPLVPLQHLLLTRTVALQRYSSTMYIATAYCDIGQQFFYLRDFSTSLLFFDRAKPYLPGSPGAWVWATYHLFLNLARMQALVEVLQFDEAITKQKHQQHQSPMNVQSNAVADAGSTQSKSEPASELPPTLLFDDVMDHVSSSVTLLSLFAKFCPDNWQHRIDLLQAEQLRCFMYRRPQPTNSVSVNESISTSTSTSWSPNKMLLTSLPQSSLRHPEYVLPALHLYDQSILRARKYHFVQDEALANELAGEFCLGLLERKHEGQAYLRAALTCWDLRGSKLKVQQLQERFPFLGRSKNKKMDQQQLSSYESEPSEESLSSSESQRRTIESDTTTTSCIITSGSSSSSTSSTSSRSSTSAISSPEGDVLVGATSTAPSLHSRSEYTTGSSSSQYHELEITAVMKAAQAYSCETDIDVLLERLMRIVLQHSSASRAVLFLEQDGEWRAELQASVNQIDSIVDTDEASSGDQLVDVDPSTVSTSAANIEHVHIHKQAKTCGVSQLMPQSIFTWLINSRQTLSFSFDKSGLSQSTTATGNSTLHELVRRDPFYRRVCPRSVLALPVLKGGELLAILYLENHYSDVSVSFTPHHIQILQLLCSQASLSLENARFTQRLQERNEQLLAEVERRQLAVLEMKAAMEVAESAAQARIDFVNVMSHEIRTPLNCVLVMSRLLVDTNLTDEQLHFTQLITHSSRLLTSIISDVLDFSRFMSGKLELEMQPFVLLDCIESALHLCMLMTLQSGVDLAYQLDPNLPSVVFGDSMHLQQILMNLCSNAAKYTNHGHINLSVTMQQIPEESHQNHGPHAANPSPSSSPSSSCPQPLMLHFCLRDTGIGIAPDVQKRLFIAFEQADPSTRRRFGGTGLGLAIAKQLTEAMHGRIELKSTPGVGSEFRFCVRVHVANSLTMTPAATTTAAATPISSVTPALAIQTTLDEACLSIPLLPTQSIYSHALESSTSPVRLHTLLICDSSIFPVKVEMLRGLLKLLGSIEHVEDWSQATTAWQSNRGREKDSSSTPSARPSIDLIVWVQPRGTLAHHPHQLLTVLRENRDEIQTTRPISLFVLGTARSVGTTDSSTHSMMIPLTDERHWWPNAHVVTLLEPFQHMTFLHLIQHREELPSDHDIEESSVPQPLPSTLSERASTMFQQPLADESAPSSSSSPSSTVTSPRILNRSTRPTDVNRSSSTQVQGLGVDTDSSMSADTSARSVSTSVTPSSSMRTITSSSSHKRTAKISTYYPHTINRTIMIVDDNKVNVKILLKLLERLGWSPEKKHSVASSSSTTEGNSLSSAPLIAYNGQQCLDQLTSILNDSMNAGHRLPTLILLDVAMDGMDGLDCTRHIRSSFDAKYREVNLPPPYIIACTATASVENRRACDQAGMQAFLSKPLDIDVLIEALLLGNAQLQKQEKTINNTLTSTTTDTENSTLNRGVSQLQ